MMNHHDGISTAQFFSNRFVEAPTQELYNKLVACVAIELVEEARASAPLAVESDGGPSLPVMEDLMEDIVITLFPLPGEVQVMRGVEYWELGNALARVLRYSENAEELDERDLTVLNKLMRCAR